MAKEENLSYMEEESEKNEVKETEGNYNLYTYLSRQLD